MNATAPLVEILNTTSTSTTPVKKRGVPNVRWLSRARLDAETPPEGVVM
jgi:hypothetical protein